MYKNFNPTQLVAVRSSLLKGESLPIMESFYTIQGEGYHQGSAAYFIRVGGCDVGCHWCDVKESWDSEKHPLVNIQQLADSASTYAKMAVITGGEPLMWEMNPLTEALNKLGVSTHIETSGAYELSGTWNWVCLSPKKLKPVTPSVYWAANELKMIIYNKSDFKYAEEQAENVSEFCKLYLQPEWSRREIIMPDIVAYVLSNPKWKLTLQAHKYMNVP